MAKKVQAQKGRGAVLIMCNCPQCGKANTYRGNGYMIRCTVCDAIFPAPPAK